MSDRPHLQLATARDVPAVAAMSRDPIEAGLRWSWTPARVRRALASATVLLVLLAPPRGIAVPVESTLALGIRVPVAPLLAAVEARVPREVRQDRGWYGHEGLRVRYAARRAPLELHLQGDSLLVRALVGYWVEARKDVLGHFPVRGSCGVDEPPRGVVLTLVTRFGLRPDWRLATQTTVLPPQFLNPCEMTFAGIDVTGSVARALHEKLWQAAQAEIDQEAPRLGDLRVPAALAWQRLHAPIQVEDRLWLQLNPTEVWASQPVAEGGTLDMVVGLSARPRLRDTAPAEPVAIPPLPALRVAPPGVPGLELPIRLAITHTDAERLLQSQLEGRPLEWAGREVTLDRVRLVGSGGVLAVEATLSGAVAGTVRLSGTPDYDGETGEIYLREVDYSLRTEDLDLQRLERGLHELVRAVVEQRARWPLRERLGHWRERVERALAGALPPPFALCTRLNVARPSAVRVTDTAIVLEGVLEGEARLTLD